MLATAGLLAGPAPDKATLADLRIAWNAAHRLGMRDKGQAAIAHLGCVKGLETRAGTDALIARAGEPGAVFAKIVKPGQDERFDMPAIGSSTALRAATKGIKAIAIQADGVILLERDRLIDICKNRGISLISYSAAGPDQS
jgi:hypothetical protein